MVVILKEMGFLTVQEMWYSREGCEKLETRLVVLVDDGTALEMLKIENTHGEVHLILVHVVSQAEVMLLLGDGVEPEGVEVEVEDAHKKSNAHDIFKRVTIPKISKNFWNDHH